MPTSHGCSTSSITWHRRDWLALYWPTVPCLLTSLAKERFARRSLRTTWWTVWLHCPDSFSIRHRFLSAFGFWLGTRRTEDSATEGRRLCSLTPARWERWWTESTVN